MGEFELIRQYFARGGTSEDVVTGIGDDCAILRMPAGHDLAVSIDTMVSGVHFPDDTPPGKIGGRVLGAALSDLAAMGANPHWFTLALTLPKADNQWLADFSDGLLDAANRYGCCLVGGDTTRGPLCVTVQVHGSVAPGAVMRRDGANPDDVVYVTGTLGDGAAALALLQKKLTVCPSSYDYLMRRFYSPAPRLQEGALLVSVASSAIDISDGLCADLAHVCEASGVGALVDITRVPVSAYWKDYVNEDKCYQWALSGGDDYELCFTVPRKQVGQVEQWIKAGKLAATAIGKVVSKPGIVLAREGRAYSLKNRGFNHFG